MRKLLPTLVLGSALLAYVTACSDSSSGPVTPAGTCSGTPFTLGSLEGKTVLAADLPCLTVAPDGGTYLIVPQFATSTAAASPVDFSLKAGTATAASGSVVLASRHSTRPSLAPAADLGKMQRQFEGMLRQRERSLSAAARVSGGTRGPLANRVFADVVPPSTRNFKVRTSLTGNGTTVDTANLKYSGTHLLIYESTKAPGPADGIHGFTNAQITAFGNTFDLDLYTIDVATFGAPSDIDGNGRVIVLLSPLINKLTPSATCATQGYIAGFFDATDLLPSDFPAASNDAELFYALVPDPGATVSCAHSVDAVEQLTPSTFIHEFQHMISFGQHSIIRNGDEEVPWLNEGLSHIAEELGSRYYENRFPAPTGRTDPDQAFPDSAQGFISGDLYNSYHFLLETANGDTTDAPSVSDWGDGGDGTLVQRGGAWLFLRWLGDQQDSLVYGRLDQTTNTDVANVQAASGTSFPTLFGEFSLALYTDSLPGVARSSIPSAYRFTSRNLRALYAKQSVRNNSTFPVSFPIEAFPIAVSQTRTESMFPGSMSFFVLTAPSSGTNTVLTFTPPTG
jgi:hypothetical protein